MQTECISCRKPKAQWNCGICEEALCRKCAVALPSDAFFYQVNRDEKTQHPHYCGNCFDNEISPLMEQDQETLERARLVYVFFTSQKKPAPVLERSKEWIKIQECEDRDRLILQLAYLAAEQGYNGILETEVIQKKVRAGAYQTSTWSGQALPVQVDARKMELLKEDE